MFEETYTITLLFEQRSGMHNEVQATATQIQLQNDALHSEVLLHQAYVDSWKQRNSGSSTQDIESMPHETLAESEHILTLYMMHDVLDNVSHDHFTLEYQHVTCDALQKDTMECIRKNLGEYFEKLIEREYFETLGAVHDHYPRSFSSIVQDGIKEYENIEALADLDGFLEQDGLNSFRQMEKSARLLMSWLHHQDQLKPVLEIFTQILNETGHPIVKEERGFDTFPVFLTYLLSTWRTTVQQNAYFVANSAGWSWIEPILIADFIQSLQYQKQAVEKMYALCSLEIESSSLGTVFGSYDTTPCAYIAYEYPTS